MTFMCLGVILMRDQSSKMFPDTSAHAQSSTLVVAFLEDWGNYKTWTLDWTGLWTGLNYGHRKTYQTDHYPLVQCYHQVTQGKMFCSPHASCAVMPKLKTIMIIM